MEGGTKHYIYISPIGRILLSREGDFLTESRFLPEEDFVEGEIDLHPVFQQAIAWLNMYFAGINPGNIPPVHLDGTPFRLVVWRILQEIPYGHTVTYKQIAEIVKERTGAERMSAQAVGNAVGHNPVGIFIPCHRVVGSNGNLTGYAGGIDKKVKLLETEHIDMSYFFLS